MSEIKKIVNWDYLNVVNREPLEELPLNSIVGFVINETNRFEVRVVEDGLQIKFSGDFGISVEPVSTNVIIVKQNKNCYHGNRKT